MKSTDFQKHTQYFDLFLGASNLRSLQATNLKCAEYVDILVQVTHAKFNNDRSHRKGHFKKIARISAVCISLCYNSMSKLLPYVGRDTGNNLLVQYASSCYTFRIIQP